MSTESFEQLYKLNKNLTGPIQEWNKTATSLYQKFAQQNLEIMTENMSRVSDQLKRLSSAKKPEEFFSIQKDCINEDVTAVIENVQKVVHTTMENIEEMTKLCGTFCEPANTILSTKKHERERDK